MTKRLNQSNSNSYFGNHNQTNQLQPKILNYSISNRVISKSKRDYVPIMEQNRDGSTQSVDISYNNGVYGADKNDNKA